MFGANNSSGNQDAENWQKRQFQDRVQRLGRELNSPELLRVDYSTTNSDQTIRSGGQRSPESNGVPLKNEKQHHQVNPFLNCALLFLAGSAISATVIYSLVQLSPYLDKIHILVK
jgi:hypothetical protein